MRPTPIEVDLPQIAQVLLDTAAAALGGSAPERRYRAAGFAVQDLAACGCDSQLTVSITGSTPGPGSAGAGTQTRTEHYLRSVTFTVDLVRSVPVIGNDNAPPSADTLDASGAGHMADYRLLDQWMRGLGWESKITIDLKAAGASSIGPSSLSTVGPSGGVVSLRASIAVLL